MNHANLFVRARKEAEMDLIIRVLIDRLTGKGMELSSIPAFIRNLANTMAVSPRMSLQELNSRLHMLGWSDIELDEYTFQLILTSFNDHRGYQPTALFEAAHGTDSTDDASRL